MTVVIAQRQNDQILILADTKIIDPRETRPNSIPGRLKAVILGPGLSVAFAGNADSASLTIKDARNELRLSGIAKAIELIQSRSSDGNTDYIIACHNPEAKLLCLRRGGQINVKDICSIGDDDYFKNEIRRAQNSRKSLLEGDLRGDFLNRLLSGENLGGNIGGFPVAIAATSENHYYLGCFGFYTFKFPILEPEMQNYQPIEQVYTGDGHFELGVLPPESPNLPILGAYSFQARMGYIYSPIEQVDAFSVQLWPPEQPWEGHEQEMLEVLRKAMNDHILAISQMKQV